MATTLNGTTYQNSELAKLVELAKSLGYKVYRSARYTDGDRVGYVHISNGVTFGTVQTSFGGLSYSTNHIPAKGIGSGFGVTGEVMVCDTANVERIKESLTVAPKWVSRSDRELVKKQTFEEYRGSKNQATAYVEI